MSFQLQETLNRIAALKEANNAAIKENKEKNTNHKVVEEKTFDLMEKMTRNMYGDVSMGRASIQEALTTTDTVKLIPKVIEGKLREAAEPEYLGTRFFQTVRVDGGNSAVYVIPVVGEVTAYEVGEGTRYKETALDYNTYLLNSYF